ncbi:MAG: hypothetical protein FWH27_18480, partial [Planctomycetaceae bacterium]|nr:hypothetical protein [Planctomycetaceae bacterium]
MPRTITLAALVCLVCASPAWSQSGASLMQLVESNLVRNTGMIYLIVPGPLNDEPGQGEYYLVFYVGVVSPSPGIASHTHGMITVSRNNGMFTVVSTIPSRDPVTDNITMSTPFAPDRSRGDDNLIFYTR